MKFHPECVVQRDCMQCGAACIAMIVRGYGKKYSLAYISSLCQPRKNGVTLKAINDTLTTLGCDTLPGKMSVDTLCRIFPGPCILHWNENHFVVLYRIKGKSKFYILDPAVGRYVCNKEQFESHWVANSDKKGVVILIDSTNKFEQLQVGESQSRRNPWKMLKLYFKPHIRLFVKVIMALLFMCLLQLIMPFLMQGIVDKGIASRNINIILLILVGELMIVGGKTVADFVRRRFLLLLSKDINIALVSDFFVKILKLPMSFFDIRLTGDMLQRIADHSRVLQFLTEHVISIVFATFIFCIFSVVLLSYDVAVFSIYIVGILMSGIWLSVFIKKRKILDYELFAVQSENNSRTYQFVTATQEIKLQGCQKRRTEEWKNTQEKLFDIQFKSLHLQQTQEAGSIFIDEIKNIFIIVITAAAVINGNMSMGAMLAIQYIVGQLNSPASLFVRFVYSMQDVKISLERINEIHEADSEDTEGKGICAYSGGKSIKFENVSFQYNPFILSKTIDNVSFDMEEGKVTAIVGSSGSGKTTLIKLMLGYYGLNEGLIFIGDTSLTDYNLRWLRKQFGVVMQESVIFSDTIARNIAMDDEDVDKERLSIAAKTACIDGYIERLPHKYETVIGPDGTGLSRGQQQRILIARAVYKNPQFIFLDEATNALDAKNERMIVDNLWNFYKGRTVVIAAHRLSTVVNADKIIVLEHGKVAEIGNHATLIAKRGLYYNLVKSQLELVE